jgi:hypothetical protein
MFPIQEAFQTTPQLKPSHISSGYSPLSLQSGLDSFSGPGRVGFVLDKVALLLFSFPSKYFVFACRFSFHQLLHIH